MNAQRMARALLAGGTAILVVLAVILFASPTVALLLAFFILPLESLLFAVAVDILPNRDRRESMAYRPSRVS